MLKKTLTSILISFIFLSFFSINSFVVAEDNEEENVEDVQENAEDNDEENIEVEKSDRNKCIEDKDEEACKIVAKSATGGLSEIEKRIADARKNKDEAYALADEYAKKADVYQDDIDKLKQQIEVFTSRIKQLEKQIKSNEKKVDEINGRVKDRMIASQKTMHFNGYLEFILGSKSFTDMLRRIYGVKSVTSKDESDRTAYIEIIEKLNTDKTELDNTKKILDSTYDTLVVKQTELIEMKKYYEEKAKEFEEELDIMTAERDNYYESFSDLKAVLKEIGYTINDGFVAAVHNSYITETVWHYSDGYLGLWHTGVDYAASRGTEIHAPAGGIIIRADDSCGEGYLHNACGEWIAGGGNQVYLICEVDETIYGFIFFHLNTVKVGYGDIVLQDEVIGTVGSSGSSTGPHCHIEMYKLGSGKLEDFFEMNWNVTFSCGRHEDAYNNRCSVSGAPCVCDPTDYLPG